MKALLLENIHPAAVARFEGAGIEVEQRRGAMSTEELLGGGLDGVDLLGIRSATHLGEAAFAAAPRLKAVGCFCIGTNQVDLPGATDHQVAVFNAPHSNSRSVVELVIGEIVVLARRLEEKSTRMHDGVWDKSAAGSHEIRGRTLGIVGYGNIGSQLSVLAEAMGLRVIFFDIADRLAHGNARRMPSLEALLTEADIVTLHVDGRPGNAGMFGPAYFDLMKPRSLFINASRGMLVDTEALRERVLSGHIAGVAMDVFPIEPKAQGDPFESPLRGLPNVILTPHVGGSTQEAQEEIGHFVSGKLLGYVEHGTTALSVNLPEAGSAPEPGTHRVTMLHRNVPGVLAELNATLAGCGANVLVQSLATRGEQGYVVTDTAEPLAPSCVDTLAAMPETVLLRTMSAPPA